MLKQQLIENAINYAKISKEVQDNTDHVEYYEHIERNRSRGIPLDDSIQSWNKQQKTIILSKLLDRQR